MEEEGEDSLLGGVCEEVRVAGEVWLSVRVVRFGGRREGVRGMSMPTTRAKFSTKKKKKNEGEVTVGSED